ncbi:MAG: hypothetical protein ACJASL_000238 [Paraglaciecola sp.]|jgi:hypothetical protein
MTATAKVCPLVVLKKETDSVNQGVVSVFSTQLETKLRAGLLVTKLKVKPSTA